MSISSGLCVLKAPCAESSCSILRRNRWSKLCWNCLRRTTKKSHCETENHFQRNSNTQTHYLIAFVSDLTEGGHHGLERQSSIICPILRHLLPIMVKLFISSTGTEEETLRKHSAKSRNRGRSERQNQPNQ